MATVNFDKPNLVNREKELYSIAQAINEVQIGKGNLIFIEGEAGVGKSRLLDSLQNELNLNIEKFLILASECLKDSEPYQPIKEILRKFFQIDELEIDKVTEEKLQNLLDNLLHEEENVMVLKNLLISKLQNQNSILANKDKFETQAILTSWKQKLHLSIASILAKVSNTKSLILLIDDLHNADQDSLEFICQRMARIVKSRNILIICAIRTEEKSETLTKQTKDLLAKDLCKYINLQPLDTPSISRLIDQILVSSQIQKDIEEKIIERTEGNALFTIEILKLLIEKKLLFFSENKWLAQSFDVYKTIPPKITALIESQLDLLSSRSREVAAYASIIGRSFSPNLLANRLILKDLELTEKDLFDVCFKELEKKNIIVSRNHLCLFSHALIREVIYSGLGTQRDRLHKLIAQALLNASNEEYNTTVDEIAWHLYYGAHYSEAFEYLISAGDIAFDTYAFDGAIKLYEAALNCLEKMSSSDKTIFDRDKVKHLILNLGHCLHITGDWEKAIKVLESSLTHLSIADDFDTYARLKIDTGLIYLSEGKWEKLKQYFQDLLNTNDSFRSNEIIAATINNHIGTAFRELRQLNKAEEYYYRTVSKKEKIKSNSILSESYRGLGMLFRYKGEYDKAIEYLHNALGLLNANDEFWLGITYHSLGTTYKEKGDTEKAVFYLTKSKTCKEKLGDILGIARTNNALADIEMRLGNLQAALELYKESLEIREKINDAFGLGITYYKYAILLDRKNENKMEALDYFKRSLEIFQQNNDQARIAEVLLPIGVLHGKMENISKAEECLNKCISICHKLGDKNREGLAYLELGRIYYNTSNYEKGKVNCKSAMDVLELLNNPNDRRKANAYLLLAKNLIGLQEFDDARQWLEAAHLIFENLEDKNEIQKVTDEVNRIRLLITSTETKKIKTLSEIEDKEDGLKDVNFQRIEKLANLMYQKHISGETYTLVIGAGASVESGAPYFGKIMDDVISAYGEKAGLTKTNRLSEFYNTLDNLSSNERHIVFSHYFRNIAPSEGYIKLATLVRLGYFKVIFTTNFDTLLEDALIKIQASHQDNKILIVGESEIDKITQAIKASSSSVKIIKLHGCVTANMFFFTPEEIFGVKSKTIHFLEEYLSKDTLIIGHSMRDQDITHSINISDGSLWYVNPTHPHSDEQITAILRARRSSQNIISGNYGRFENFISNLYSILSQKSIIRVY